MKRPEPQGKSNEQLVELFKGLSFRQADAIGVESNAYAEASKKLRQIADELRRRGPEARRALLPLLECSGAEAGPNLRYAAGSQCRYNAAWELLAVEPDRARATLDTLAAKGAPYAQFLARGTLARLENGSFKPT